MTCSCSAKDIRELLEGYCLDCRTQTNAAISVTADSAEAVLTAEADIKPHAKIEAPIQAELLSKDGLNLVFDKPFPETGEIDAVFLQYETISDDWLCKTRDYQIIPIVRRMTGVRFDGETRVTEFHSGTGSAILPLNNRPVTTIHNIAYVNSIGAWSGIDAGSVEIIAEEGLIKARINADFWQYRLPFFARGTDNIKVDYSYGYDDAPCDVKRAVCMLAASQALAQIGARTGGGSLSGQGFNRQYGNRGKYTDYRNELERWAHSLLRPYVTGILGQ
jgi:hypothetical protein